MSSLRDLYPNFDANEEKEVVLPSGLRATIRKGNGQDAMQAGRLANGDQAKVYPAMMAILVKIEGQKFPMEEFAYMPMDDFQELIVALTDNEEKKPLD